MDAVAHSTNMAARVIVTVGHSWRIIHNIYVRYDRVDKQLGHHRKKNHSSYMFSWRARFLLFLEIKR